VDESIASAIAVFIGALTTVLLMAGAYYFGPGARAGRGRDRGERSDDEDDYRRFKEWQHDHPKEP
jgi:hypothetical protein